MSSGPVTFEEYPTFTITDAKPASNDEGEAALLLTTAEGAQVAFSIDRQIVPKLRDSIATVEAFLMNGSNRVVVTAAVRVRGQRTR
jgi:hypothetical protein